MIQIYSIEHNTYYCEGQYESYGKRFYMKMEELLREYPPQQIVITRDNDIIKRQFEGLEDGL